MVLETVEIAGLVITIGGLIWHLSERLTKMESSLTVILDWIGERKAKDALEETRAVTYGRKSRPRKKL